MNNDKHIIFKTGADNSDLEKDLKIATKEIERMEAELKKSSESEVAAVKAKKEAYEQLQKARKSLTAVQTERDRDIESQAALVQSLDEAKIKVQQAEAAVKRYREAWAQVVAAPGVDQRAKNAARDALESAKGQLSAMEARYSEIRAQIDSMEPTIERATRNVREQEIAVQGAATAYNEAAAAAQDLAEKNNLMRGAIESAKGNAGELVKQIARANSLSGKASSAMKAASKRTGELGARISKMASCVFVFTLITTALRSMRTWLGNVIKSNDEAQASIAKLKGALLTLAQPIINVVIPAFTKLVNMLAKVTAMAANVVSKLFGTTASASADAAENLYNEMNAVEGVGEAAEEAAGSLAGFDEINTISTENSSSGVGSGATDVTIAPDFSGVIDEKLGAIEAVVGGALLALGAILAFSGVNIPLGITLMALGALTLAAVVKENWDAISQALQGPIGVVTAAISAALLALGAIFAFSGANIPLGIALMVLGSAGLATAVAVNWNTLSNVLQGPIGIITEILCASLLVLGAILTFSGVNISLGLGLMAAGAIGLAAVVAANWDTVSQVLQGPIGTVTALISAALLVIGAILTFSGGNIGLGIGLLVVGAVGLATAIAPNWEAIQTALQGPIGTITAIVSTAFLVLGAILTLSGVAIPLGLGLLVVGAVGLVTSLVANWDSITNTLGGTLSTILTIIYAATLVLGIILLFTGAGIPLGLGLIVASAAGLVSTIAPNWSYIQDKLKYVWGSIKNWWNTNVAKYFTAAWWKQLGKDMLNGLIGSVESGLNSALSGAGTFVNKIIGVLNKIPGVDIDSVSWGNIQLPRLATGAVIPPNREFLAVLGDQKSGTNIEAPLSTIEQALENVLARTGGMGGDINITVESVLDGKVVARNTVKHINDMTRQAGKPVLLF